MQNRSNAAAGSFVYHDNNATTPLAPEVLAAIVPVLTDTFGNPSSPHRLGVAAARLVESARLDVADLFGTSPERVVFTGGGTESIATAVAAGRALRPTRRTVVCSSVEHPASSAPLKREAELGRVDCVVVPVARDGLFVKERLMAAIGDDTAIVSLLWGNNETGVVQPRELLRDVAAKCRRHGALLHLDAVQMAGKAELDVEELGADFVSISGHKFHAPKGVGALFVRDDAEFAPFVLGGSQERQRRAGTVATANVVGLGVAARLACEHLRTPGALAALAARRDGLERELARRVEGVSVNGAGAARTPNTSNVSFEGVNGNALLAMLSEHDVFVSTGSACGSNRKKASPVLVAMGVDVDLASASLRLSLSRFTTDAEVERGVDTIARCVARLRAMAPAEQPA
jgi:cysteine desulfurase